MADTVEVLVIVKAAPTLSRTHGEIVCTAGITRDGKWIRLYPMPYRELPYEKRFKKFQWIRIKAGPSNEKLRRPESKKITDINSLELLTELPHGLAGWKEREKYFLPLVSKSLDELEELRESKGVSLGMFKPKQVSDFVITAAESEWDEKKKGILSKQKLFGIKNAPLEKIPYKFSYRFICEDKRCTGHDMIFLDWEVSEGYRNFKSTYRSESLTLQKMKEKWLDYFFRDRESYFVVGTDSEFNRFMILGIVSPRRKSPSDSQLKLL